MTRTIDIAHDMLQAIHERPRYHDQATLGAMLGGQREVAFDYLRHCGLLSGTDKLRASLKGQQELRQAGRLTEPTTRPKLSELYPPTPEPVPERPVEWPEAVPLHERPLSAGEAEALELLREHGPTRAYKLRGIARQRARSLNVCLRRLHQRGLVVRDGHEYAVASNG